MNMSCMNILLRSILTIPYRSLDGEGVDVGIMGVASLLQACSMWLGGAVVGGRALGKILDILYALLITPGSPENRKYR